MAGRNTQVSRIYATLTLLEGAPQGLTVADICSRLADRGHAASKRTIYRDLEALESAGFPLSSSGELTDEGATRWTLERTKQVTPYLVLTVREMIALYLSKNALKPLEGSPFFQDLESTFAKIQEKLGSKHQEFLADLQQEIQFQPMPKWGLGVDPDTLETIRSACGEGHELRVEYDSASSKSKRSRRLGPHYLYFAKGGIYLVAEDLEDETVKLFSVARMSKATMSENEYLGEIKSAEELFSSSMGLFIGKDVEQVQIDFGPKAAPYVRERSWHPSQRIVNHDDGTLSLFLEVANTPELVQWVLGFGPEATIKSPEKLARQVVNQAQLLLKRYGTKLAG